jgi:hypothetical protein
MKINWKRILIAAIWSELVIAVIYISSQLYAGSIRRLIDGIGGAERTRTAE